MKFSNFGAEPKKITIAFTILFLVFGAMSCTDDADDDEERDVGDSLHVEPEQVEMVGGDTCADVGQELGIEGAEFWLDCKIDDLDNIADGEHIFTDEDDFDTNAEECAEQLRILMDIYETDDGQEFDWESLTGVGIRAVLAKGGPDANFYLYDPSVTADEGLHAPECSGGSWCDLSHVSFCVGLNLDVSKTAVPTFGEVVEWEIDKSVSPDAWNLFTGDSGVSDYEVLVDVTDITEEGFAVSGLITIENNTTEDALIESVTDEVNGLEADVDCGDIEFPYLLEAGEELVCEYQTDLPDDSNLLNTATVTVTEDSVVGGGTAEAEVSFADLAPGITNETVTIVDDIEDVEEVVDGQLGTCSVEDAPCLFEYEKTFVCDDDEGTYINTATIEETGQDSMASVDVVCYGLEVNKEAPATSFGQRYFWDIEKSVTPDSFEADGTDYEMEYTISVGLAEIPFVDLDFLIDGTATIEIFNPNPEMGADINDISDVLTLADGSEVDVDVTCVDEAATPVVFPYNLGAEELLICSYDLEFDTNPCPENGAECENLVVAELQNYAYAADTSAVENGTTDFFDAVMFFVSDQVDDIVDGCVDVTDTNEEFAAAYGVPEVCFDDELPQTFTYTAIFSLPQTTPMEECAAFSHINVATATAQDTGTEVTDDAEVICTDVLGVPPKTDEELEEKERKKKEEEEKKKKKKGGDY